MCNLSKGVEERGIQKGIEKGIIYGVILMCKDLDMSEEKILEKIQVKFNLTEEEGRKYLNEIA